MIRRLAWAIDARERKLRLLRKIHFPHSDKPAESAVQTALFASVALAHEALRTIADVYPKARVVPVRFMIERAARNPRRRRDQPVPE